MLRTPSFIYLSLGFIFGLALISYLGIQQNRLQQNQQQAAKKHVRGQWDNIDAMNPHSAAHYGSYAFKTTNALGSIDEGINSITGNVLRLEGHVQNEISYSETSQSLAISKFGKLKPSLLLQYVIPLLLIFLAFTSVSTEKESGRLKLLVFQGVPLSGLIFAKALSVWIYGVLLLGITVILQLVLNAGSGPQLGRIFFLVLSYVAYYYIISLLATWFSAKLKSSASSLSVMLALWILWTIFLPRIWGNTTDKLHPLPSRQVFKASMQEDRAKGLDGHDPSDQRSEAFKKQVLAKYKAEKLEDLPINYDGLRMQADEEYGNQVWDRHFGNNSRILQKQRKLYGLSGLFNPFASLQNASMGFAGSDLAHHLDFLQQAENYRRYLIKTLNEKQAYGGSKTGDWDWAEQNTFYRSVKDFNYLTPSIESIQSKYALDLAFLAFWAIIASLIVLFTAKKIQLL